MKDSASKKRREPARVAAVVTMPPSVSQEINFDWVKDLAAPYLRGYKPTAVTDNGLRGFSFSVKSKNKKAPGTLGFFVGFLTDPAEFAYLKPVPPECLIYAFIDPIGKPLHHSQVLDEEGTLRWTFGYIGWLTHRPPRFKLFDDQATAMVRHFSMRDWPREKYEHFSKNFFIETLAWLVRSGLVRRWLDRAESK